MTLGTILGASFQVMRRNPRPTLGPALILSVVITVVAAVGFSLYIGALTRASTAVDPSDAEALLAGTVVVALLVGLLGVAAIAVATAVLQAILVTEVARGTVGEKLRLGEILAKTRGRIGPVIGYTVLLIVAATIGITLFFGIVTAVTFATTAGGNVASPSNLAGTMLATFGVVILGYLGVAVIALWLGTRLAFVPAAIVLERLPIRAAMVRSWTLTRGYFWRTLGIQLLVSVMISVATQIVTFPVSLILGLAVPLLIPTGGTDTGTMAVAGVIALLVSALVVSVVTAVGLVLQSATASLLYLDLRMRKEGLDLELSRFVEARQAGVEVADPYLPAQPSAQAPAAS
jgi:membrane-anchored glycerophosphoryl diester phosphodiesterase (GDPDase)